MTRSTLKCDLLNTRLFLIKIYIFIYIYCHLLFYKIYICHVLNINRLIIIHLFDPLSTYALKWSLLNTQFSLIKKKNAIFFFVNIIIQGRSQNAVVLCIYDFPKTTPHLISFLILKVTNEFFFFLTYLNRPTSILTILKYFTKIVASEYIYFHFYTNA